MPKQKGTPPNWGMRLLNWLCKEELLEEIEGDLYEEFLERRERLGPGKARWIYGFQVISFLRPFALKKISSLQLTNPLPMLIHYLKVALRNAWKQKLSSAINLLGLSIGMGCCILIFLFIQNEFSFDTFHTDLEPLLRQWGVELVDDRIAADIRFAERVRYRQDQLLRICFLRFRPIAVFMLRRISSKNAI